MRSSDGMEEYLEKYREMFDEQFPLMACLGMSEEDIIEEIQRCIEQNRLYEYDTNRFY